MKSRKFKEITDDMIGMDDRICNCASKVVDILVALDETKKSSSSVRGIVDSIKKGKTRSDLTEQTKGKGKDIR